MRVLQASENAKGRYVRPVKFDALNGEIDVLDNGYARPAWFKAYWMPQSKECANLMFSLEDVWRRIPMDRLFRAKHEG